MYRCPARARGAVDLPRTVRRLVRLLCQERIDTVFELHPIRGGEPRRFTSLAALRDGVNRRNDYLNPKMSPQEIEDVVAYLNETYYRFPQ